MCHGVKEEEHGLETPEREKLSRGHPLGELMRPHLGDHEGRCSLTGILKEEEESFGERSVLQEEDMMADNEEDVEGRSLADEEASPVTLESPHRKRPSRLSLALALQRDQEPVPKKWKDVRWKLWSLDFVGCTKYEPPSDEEVARLLDAQDICVKPDKPVEDTRRCILCHDVGDGETNGPAR